MLVPDASGTGEEPSVANCYHALRSREALREERFMDGPAATGERKASWPSQWLAWLLVAVACLVVAGARWRLRGVPIERDEGEYAYFGQLLLAGFPPFRLAYSLKLPGTQAAYAVIMTVFGETPAGIRIGLLFVNAATTVLVFLLGRRVLNTVGAVAAAMAFAFLSLESAFLGSFAHATHFVVSAAVAGLLLLLRAQDSGRLRLVLASGVLLGVAMVMKQTGIVYLAFAATWLAFDRRAMDGRRLLAGEGTLLLGAALPLTLIVAWVVAGGTVRQFWFWVIQNGRDYATSPSVHYAAELFADTASRALQEAWVLWALVAAGFVAAAWPGSPRRERAFLLGLSVASFAGVSIGFYYRPHYFVLALPAAGLLVGALVRFAVGRAKPERRRLAAIAALALVVAGGAQVVWEQRRIFLDLGPTQISRTLSGMNPFPEALEIARYIAARTGPEDRIAVLGSEPEIPFYARRRSATGHVYMYGLMGPEAAARAMQEEMAREIEATRPAYIVWVLMPVSWLMKADSDPWLLRWAQAYVTTDYELVGLAEILDVERTAYYWDDLANQAPGPADNRIAVFRRRDFKPRAGP